MDIQNSETRVLLEWCRAIAELVQQDTQSPHIRFLVNGSSQIGIDHFRYILLECGVLVEVGFGGDYRR